MTNDVKENIGGILEWFLIFLCLFLFIYVVVTGILTWGSM